MTRQVYDNRMTAHVWANQSQPSGRSNNGNLSFSGRKLYSYRTVIGMIMPDDIKLETTTSYSITTGGHMRDLSNAIRGRAYGVENLDSIADELDAMASRGKDTADYIKTRLREYLAKYAANWTAEPTESAAYRWESETARRDIFPVYVLRRIGERNPEAKWTRIHAAAAKAKAKAIEDGKRKLRDSRLVIAKKASRTTPALFAAWKGRTLLEHCNPLSTVERMALDLHHARGAAKAAGWNRVAKECAALLKQVRAFAAYIRERERPIQHNRALRQSVQNVRNWTKPDTFERLQAQGIEALAETISRLASAKGLQPAQRANMAAVANELMDRVPGMRADETRRREVQNQVDRLDQILRRAAREKAEEQRRADWFAGVPSAYWSGVDEHGNAFMRVVGDELQTSRGASVPLSHAIRVFKFVKYHHDLNADNPNRSGTAWKHNGHSVRVGHFTVDYVRIDGGFTAGCHNFAWDEIARVASAAGVFDLPASAEAIESSH